MILYREDIDYRSSLYENGDVLIGEDNFNEATGEIPLPATSKEPPEDFKKSVIKTIEKGYEKSNKGVGTNPFDAGMATFGILYRPFLQKAKEKIDSKPVKNIYTLIVPQKLRVKPDSSGYANLPKEYEELTREMLKNAGFKKGSSFKFGKNDIYYYYKYSPDKKFIYMAMYSAPAVYFVLRSQLQIFFRCCDNTTEIRKELTESANEIDMTKYFAFNPEDGMDPSLVGDAEEVFYRDPVYNKAIMEHFDMIDVKTRRTLLSMNEAGQNTVLMNLTSRLYDKIVEKCDDIDYGEIPKTKGDIRKLPKYESMKECIALMHDILKEYNQDTGPVDELSVAFANIESRKDLFERAYRYNAELPIAMYCNVTLGIITGISYMIATCIEFIKDPGAENFRIALDKMAYAKTKDHLIYNTLKSFNKSCVTKEFDKAMEAILKASTKNFAAGAILGGIAISVLGIILVLIPVLRELIFMFYYLRVKISDFFDIQADLLQMNAYAIEANTTLSPTERKKVMAKQLKYVEQFRKISNTVAIEMKKAEVASDKEKRSDDETKMLIDDIGGIDPGNKSALF